MPDKFQNQPYLNKKIQKTKFHDQELVKQILKEYKKSFEGNILDVGCASGDLIFYLNKHLPKSNFTGIDLFNDTIKLAKKRGKKFKKCKFYKHDLLKYKNKKKFDIILASGLLSFFEDYQKPLNKLINLLNHKKSKIFIFGRFNSSNIDTKIKFRNNDFNSDWRDGYTSYSIKTVSQFLKKKRMRFNFKKFYLPINLKPNKNLTRSYTIITKDNKKLIVNKANIITEFYFLSISRKN